MAEYLIEPGGIARKSRLWFREIALCVIEARPLVLLIYLLRLAAGYVLVRPGTVPTPLWRPLVVVLTWLFAAGSVYLLDGVTDMMEDRLNGSSRPIARGALRREVALVVSIVWAGLALAGSVPLGTPYTVLVPLMLLLGYLYVVPPMRLKRWSVGAGATVLVAGLLTFVAGGAANGTPVAVVVTSVPLLIFAAAMSAWMGLVGALAKDFTDVYGDAAAGRRTSAVVRGAHRTAWRLSINAAAIAVVFLAAARRLAPGLLWPAAALALGAMAVILGSTRTADPRRRPGPYRAFMTTQYLAHLALLSVAMVH